MIQTRCRQYIVHVAEKIGNLCWSVTNCSDGRRESGVRMTPLRKRSGMEIGMAEKINYACGDWTDSNGNVHSVWYKTKWGGHIFSDDEQRRLLSGDEITFAHKGSFVTGHFQYCSFNGTKYFGFTPDFSDEYDSKPVYQALPQRSRFSGDLQMENDVMAEFMRFNYYEKLFNKDGTRVSDYRRITDIEEQKNGVDVVYTQDGVRYIIDEKAQMDYIYNKEPLPTFALELLNGSSGAGGWFVNEVLKTQYYMFLWPHAERRPLTAKNIEYAYYALIDKKKLLSEVEKRFHKSPAQLLECARHMLHSRMGEAVCDRNGTCVGYRYKETGFDDCGYLYHTLSKQERPVNLVVKRSFLEPIAERYGKITNIEEESI